jgi:hypothetical protein
MPERFKKRKWTSPKCIDILDFKMLYQMCDKCLSKVIREEEDEETRLEIIGNDKDNLGDDEGS